MSFCSVAFEIALRLACDILRESKFARDFLEMAKISSESQTQTFEFAVIGREKNVAMAAEIPLPLSKIAVLPYILRFSAQISNTHHCNGPHSSCSRHRTSSSSAARSIASIPISSSFDMVSLRSITIIAFLCLCLLWLLCDPFSFLQHPAHTQPGP